MTLGSRLDELLDRTVVGSFTNLGYALRSRSWDHELPSMKGKTVVITGATSGLGKAASQRLAGLAARVCLVGRSSDKLEATRQAIIVSTGNDRIDTHRADLSATADVRSLAGSLLETEERIDVLINNAGALFPERGVTPDGNERTLATNLLGCFLLTNLLIPRLRESAPARIITVSSGGMYTQRIRVGDLQSEQGVYRGSVSYARAKRGQVILTEMWAQMLQGSGVVVHAMHPGWADTPGVEVSLPTFRKLTKPFLRTPEQGADTIVWLAAAAEAAATTGKFWLDRRPRPTHRLGSTVETPDDRRALWQTLNELTGSDF